MALALAFAMAEADAPPLEDVPPRPLLEPGPPPRLEEEEGKGVDRRDSGEKALPPRPCCWCWGWGSSSE